MMDTNDIGARLIAVGDKINAKGWASASIDIYVQYLAIFDRESGPFDPMISYRPSIQASTRNKYGHPTSHQFVQGWSDAKTFEEAVQRLEATADEMPRMEDEAARIESAKQKLSDDERRLLGIR